MGYLSNTPVRDETLNSRSGTLASRN